MGEEVIVNENEQTYLFNCPWCGQFIQVFWSDLNCKIFRHGVFKDTGIQIDPHTPKNVCDKLVEDDLIYGCGRPFMFSISNSLFVEKCGYI